MKKTVLFLSLLMSFQANAACDIEGYFDCGDTGDVKWYLSSDKKTLSISGEGAMGDYEKNGDYISGTTYFTTAPWRDYRLDVENIVVSEGVTSIGVSAFRNFKKLTDVKLPNSLISVGDWAFLSDRGLPSIIIPNSVTTIGEMAFYNDKGLQSIIIPASVTDIGALAFGNKTEAVDRTIPGNVYCEQISGVASPCDSSNLGLPQERLKYYTKDDKGMIIFDGQKYSSLERLARQIPVRRIYTVNEASKAAGKKNTVMIRYK